MHQGKRSEELGIPGIPNICEANSERCIIS